jgi:hypothetical protein
MIFQKDSDSNLIESKWKEVQFNKIKVFTFVLTYTSHGPHISNHC